MLVKWDVNHGEPWSTINPLSLWRTRCRTSRVWPFPCPTFGRLWTLWNRSAREPWPGGGWSVDAIFQLVCVEMIFLLMLFINWCYLFFIFLIFLFFVWFFSNFHVSLIVCVEVENGWWLIQQPRSWRRTQMVNCWWSMAGGSSVAIAASDGHDGS